MFKTRTALLLTLPALAFGACGSSGSDSNSDEDQITSVVDAVAADPLAICDHLSADMLRRLGGKDACVRAGEASGDRGSKATIEDLAVDGDTATVRITDADGPTEVKFVKEDGDWKVAG
jgi:hypothetical protein